MKSIKGESCSLLARYALPLAYVKPEVTPSSAIHHQHPHHHCHCQHQHQDDHQVKDGGSGSLGTLLLALALLPQVAWHIYNICCPRLGENSSSPSLVRIVMTMIITVRVFISNHHHDHYQNQDSHINSWPLYYHDNQDCGVPFSVELSLKRSSMFDNRYIYVAIIFKQQKQTKKEKIYSNKKKKTKTIENYVGKQLHLQQYSKERNISIII